MYCSRCGREIDDRATNCMYCGAQTVTMMVKRDEPSFGYATIAFFFPVVGLILYLAFRDDRPKRAISLIKGTIIGVISRFLIFILLITVTSISFNNYFDTIISATDNAVDTSEKPMLNEDDLSEVSDVVDSLADNFDLFTMSSEELLKDYVDVTIGEFVVDNSNFIPETALNVTIKNKDSVKRSYSIEIEAVDASGARLDTDYLYVNDLNSNQEIHLKAFEFLMDDEIEQFKNASFKILNVEGH